MMLGLYVDALLCFVVPRLARWTVVVVDRFDGEEHPIRSVRLRWYRSAEVWIAEWVPRSVATLGPEALSAVYAVRPCGRRAV